MLDASTYRQVVCTFMMHLMRSSTRAAVKCIRRTFSGWYPRKLIFLLSSRSLTARCETSETDNFKRPSLSDHAVDTLTANETEVDKHGVTRVKFQRNGWSYWKWRGYNISYIKAGKPESQPIILVHGFASSAYHWRYILPELGKDYYVHAVDLLGFGFSDKSCIDYDDFRIWAEQLRDFVKEVLGGRKAVFIGNSLGGYASLLTSAKFPCVSSGLVFVNGAGRFEEMNAAAETMLIESLRISQDDVDSMIQDADISGNSGDRTPATMFNHLYGIAIRSCIWMLLWALRKPSSIKSVLLQIYVSQEAVDEDLVQSILIPAHDGNAPELLYQLYSSKGTSIDSLLPKLQCNMLLLWGESDPWITLASADRMQKLLPSAARVNVKGGHCPHDDLPEQFLPPLRNWLQGQPITLQ